MLAFDFKQIYHEKKFRPTKGIQISVGGDTGGQLAAGVNSTRSSAITTRKVTEAELEEFRRRFGVFLPGLAEGAILKMHSVRNVASDLLPATPML
jgi:hypothetical protein